MQWLNPAGAWAFLGLLPVIALYLLRRKAKRVPVPSLMLWRKTEERSEANKPIEKLKNQLLLWLQLLLVVLLSLALMRPASIGGSQGETALIFDLSASMRTETAGISRLDEAKADAYRLLDGLRDDDAVTVLAAGSALSQVVTRSTDHAAIRRAIESLEPQNGTADMEGALALALAMRRDLPSLGIVVYSDSYQPEHSGVRLQAVGERTENRALVSLRLSERDSGTTAFVQIENHGSAVDAEMECYADGMLCDVRAVRLEADAKQSARFSVPSGARRVMIRFAQPDALAADDARYAVNQAGTERTALLVTEGNIFLERALALREGLTVVKAIPGDAQSADGYDLYVYDGWLPKTLPGYGAVLAIAPSGEVAGIIPGAETEGAGSLRAGGGATAKALCENLLLSDVALRSYYPLTGGQAVLTTGGDALLSVSGQGGRRAAVLGFDLHDSNLPLKADFPLLIQNLLSYLLPDVSAAVEGASCGETVRPALDDRAVSADVLTPTGRELALSGGALGDTDEIGLYTLRERYADGTVRETAFALHPPAAESDTLTLAASTGEAGGQGGAVWGTGREWTPWILLLCFLVLMLEWEVSRRGA